jgi:hypothetical protein
VELGKVGSGRPQPTGTDVIATDLWTSMGQDIRTAERANARDFGCLREGKPAPAVGRP